MSRPAVEARAPRAGDAEALVASMRPQDRAEVEAIRGPGQELEAVRRGIEMSVLAWTFTIGSEMACICGVVPVSLMSDRGVPWLLGTTAMDRHPGALIRVAPAYIARMLAAFPHLLNGVDARNTLAVRWLRRAGFTLHPAVPVGPQGVPFHPFEMDVRNV